MREIVDPVIAGMGATGTQYRGFLYVGLMLTCDGPKVIEFNVRFGDPEAQVVLPSLAGELAPALMSAARGELTVERRRRASGEVLSASCWPPGLPAAGPTGLPIAGLERADGREGVVVFHAGTASRPDGTVVTAGGRVLTVVAHAATFEGRSGRPTMPSARSRSRGCSSVPISDARRSVDGAGSVRRGRSTGTLQSMSRSPF